MTTGVADRTDVMRMAQAGQLVCGQSPGSELMRWAASSVPSEALDPVTWTARFDAQSDATGQPVAWLHLEVHAELALECQRCLQPFRWPQRLERTYRFVETEAQAMAQDDEAEEDLLALEQPLRLSQLVEDELIMDLPMVPMHARCPVNIPFSSQPPDFEEQPHPFAALAQLKPGPKRRSEGSDKG